MPAVDADDGDDADEESEEDGDGEALENVQSSPRVPMREFRGPEKYFLDSSINGLSSSFGEDEPDRAGGHILDAFPLIGILEDISCK